MNDENSNEQQTWNPMSIFEKAIVFLALLICSFGALGVLIGPANSASYPHTGLANDGSELVKYVNSLGEQTRKNQALNDVLVNRVINIEQQLKIKVPKEIDVIQWQDFKEPKK